MKVSGHREMAFAIAIVVGFKDYETGADFRDDDCRYERTGMEQSWNLTVSIELHPIEPGACLQLQSSRQHASKPSRQLITITSVSQVFLPVMAQCPAPKVKRQSGL